MPDSSTHQSSVSAVTQCQAVRHLSVTVVSLHPAGQQRWSGSSNSWCLQLGQQAGPAIGSRGGRGQLRHLGQNCSRWREQQRQKQQSSRTALDQSAVPTSGTHCVDFSSHLVHRCCFPLCVPSTGAHHCGRDKWDKCYPGPGL